MLRFLHIVLLILVMPHYVAAQDNEADSQSEREVVLWNVDGDNQRTIEVFRTSVGEALAGEAGRHLLTDTALKTYVRENTGPLPGCLLGVESCPSPQALGFDALQLSFAVHVTLKTSSGQVSAKYALIDAQGAVTRESSIDAPNARDAAFNVVRDIFDATGAARFETTPAGAKIVIDGRETGTTPSLSRLPVGRHDFTLTLSGFAPFAGQVEVRKGLTDKIQHTFLELPGTLVVTDAPDGALVLVNGEQKGRVGEPISLPPGTYAIEVRADGYDTLRDAATIGSGEELQRSLPLAKSEGLFSGISSESITVNNYVFRMGFEHGIQSATYQDARNGADVPYELRSFTDGNGGFPAVGALERTVHTNGFRLDFGYQFQNIGIVLLSMSYLLGQPDEPVATTTPLGTDEPGKLVGIQRLQMRPFQLSYREFYNNFVPFVEAGMGMDFTWLDVESPRFDPQRLSQSEGFVGLGIGLQYFITPKFFGIARYSLQTYFDTGLGNDHLLLIGLGAGFPNVFGFVAEPPEKL